MEWWEVPEVIGKPGADSDDGAVLQDDPDPDHAEHLVLRALQQLTAVREKAAQRGHKGALEDIYRDKITPAP